MVKKDREGVVVMKKSHITEPTPERGHAALASTQSRILAQLCRDIAEAIKQVSLGLQDE